MPRKFFRRFSPSPGSIKKRLGARFLSHLMEDSNLFHLTRHSISMAFFIGFFVAFMPILGQIPIAIVFAYWARANLPITVAITCISNPITFPVIFFATYKFGNFLLDQPSYNMTFELSFEWLRGGFLAVWKPLLLGSFIAGLFFACVSYVSLQLLWRMQVLKRWRARKSSRKAKKNKPHIYSRID